MCSLYAKPNTDLKTSFPLWLPGISLKPRQELTDHDSRKFQHPELQLVSASNLSYMLVSSILGETDSSLAKAEISGLYPAIFYSPSTCCTLISGVPTMVSR